MRWMMAALALTVACAMGKNGPKSEAVAAQDSASAQFQKAADAQKNATEEQAKAEEADRKVQAAQKALAEARAEARGQHARAKQAQTEARDLAAQAHQQGQEQQDRAFQAQDKGLQQTEQSLQQAQSWTKEQSLEGQVLEAKGDTLRVRGADRKDVNLEVNGSTNVRIDGQMAQPTQIQPGDDVRASYQLVDGKAKALQIDVERKGSTDSGDTKDDAAANGSSGSGEVRR